MPKSDKCEDGKSIYDGVLTPAEGDVNVPDDPAVETSVPSSPKGESRVVVTHATEHVFRGFDAICHGP